MKKNYFYHPLVKGLCLVLCFTSLLAFAFCGLRVLFLESFGLMQESVQFYIPSNFNYHLRYDDDIHLYWPDSWGWENIYLDDVDLHWFSDDPLWQSVAIQLQEQTFLDYLKLEPEDAQNTDAFPNIIWDGNRCYPENASGNGVNFLAQYDAASSNLRFRVLLDGVVILSNSAAWDDALMNGGDSTSCIVTSPDFPAAHTVALEYGLLNDMPIQDDYLKYYCAWRDDAAEWEGWLVGTGIAGAAAILLLVCVLLQTGKRVSEPGIRLNVIDRLPVEPVLFVKIMLGVLAIACIAAMDWYLTTGMLLAFGYLDGNLFDWLVPVGVVVLFGITVYLGLSVLRGMVRRFRAGKWWRNTLVYRILRPFGRAVRWVWRSGCAVFASLPVTAKWLAGCAIFGIWTLFVIAVRGLVVPWFLTALAAGLLLCIYMLELDTVRGTAKKIAAGDINAHVDTVRLHGAVREIGDSLNHIGDAISVAVEDRMKSERFRTELITNVSHDLKTPLTSIINYTDLLSKEDCGNETAKEYIDVLSRQAVRLKKLTEDLLEASKASSGAISVTLTPTDAAELLTQAVGEYEERFTARNLHAVLDIRHNPLWITADGKHLWRVFDNLLSNICKYSMCGTRVYLTAERCGSSVVMTFRNITENPIAVSAEELTERFVRGDASRHTEGSGLGLAIADSLCKLQGAALSLTVDGDLFKAVVTFGVSDAPSERSVDVL